MGSCDFSSFLQDFKYLHDFFIPDAFPGAMLYGIDEIFIDALVVRTADRYLLRNLFAVFPVYQRTPSFFRCRVEADSVPPNDLRLAGVVDHGGEA